VASSYVLGLFIGAAVTAEVVYALGVAWRPLPLVVAVVAAVLGVIRIFRPRTVAIGGFKVPRHWERLGPVGYLGVFGLFLGTGVITTMPAPTMVALIIWVWMAHSVSMGLLILSLFALGRVLTSAAGGVVRFRVSTSGSMAVDTVESAVAYLARVEGATCAALGLFVLVHSLVP
jgi:hypothetical protein